MTVGTKVVVWGTTVAEVVSVHTKNGRRYGVKLASGAVKFVNASKVTAATA